MKIRNSFPKVYSQTNAKTGQIYYIVDCRSKKWGMSDRLSFSTEKEAIFKAKAVAEEITKFGGQAQIPRDVILRSDSYQSLTNRLQPFGKTPEQAVEHYISFLGEQAILNTVPRIEILVDEFQAYKLMDAALSYRTVSELKVYCRYIKKTFGQMKPIELSKNYAEMNLRQLPVSNNTRRKYLTYLRMFLNWVCENKLYLTKNPVDGINFKKEKFEKAFYPASIVKSFLKQLLEHQPRLLGYFVLSCFAGLRPSESERVEWKHINFETQELHVIKGKTDARHIRLHATAIAWLQYIKENVKSTDLIPQQNIPNMEKVAHTFMPEWIQDGLRHTFATHYNSLIKNVYDTAHYMGNSVNMVKQHYARTVPQADLDNFWGLTPAEVLKVAENPVTIA